MFNLKAISNLCYVAFDDLLSLYFQPLKIKIITSLCVQVYKVYLDVRSFHLLYRVMATLVILLPVYQ